MKRFERLLKRKSVYLPVAILILLVAGYLLFRAGNNQNTAATAEVKRADIIQEVTVSGGIKAKEAVTLAFEKSGRIGWVNGSVGKWVPLGTTLMSLENGAELAAVEDAEAKLAGRRAHYEEQKTGGRPEEVSVKETELAKALSDLATDYAAAPNILLDGFNKADSAVRRQADLLFSNVNSSNPKLSFNSSDQQATIDAELSRSGMGPTLAGLKTLASRGFQSETDTENALSEAKNHLLAVSDFLIKTNLALNSATNLTETALAANKDALNTARTNTATALKTVTEGLQTIVTQKITVEKARKELELARVGATPEILAEAEADVRSAEAGVKSARAALRKTYIISPIAGAVTKQDAKAGEIAGANAPLVAVASGNFKIEALVPEADIAKIAIGNAASVTLDAYGSDVSFAAHVVAIDPAETIVEAVSTYKTTLEFDKPDKRIRSGLTANLVITTARKENALSIPNRAIFEKAAKKFVTVVGERGKTEEREVTTGIKGSGGEVEIISGVSEGEEVFISK